MAKRKRGPSLDDKYLGPEPIYTSDSEFTSTNWAKGVHWYNYFYKQKDYMSTTHQFCKDVMGWDKKKIAVLKRLKDYRFMRVNKSIKMYYRGWQYPDEQITAIKNFIDEQYLVALKEKKVEDAKKADIVIISPAERTRMKVMETVYHDFDSTIVEGWLEGEFKQKFNAFNRFKAHGLKGNAINIFKNLLEIEYNNIKDAYEKNCEQAVEGYSNFTKGEKNKMIKQLEEIFVDLQRLKDSYKATRTTKVKKVKASDQQVSKLKYCAENLDAKLTSINPVAIPGKTKLYVYNCKNKKLMEYVTSSIGGFEISGTSIRNFEKESRQATLRKPDEILPMILNKTEKQIDKIWDTLTTKIDKPTGRVNADCILMRVF